MGDLQIYNDYVRGNDVFSFFSATVVFRPLPKTGVMLCDGGKKINLPVYESYDAKIGPNSSSRLAVKLSTDHDVFLVIYEQGADTKKATTWQKLPGVIRHLSAVARLPAEYIATEQYAELYGVLFSDTSAPHRIQRLPGMQDRDTFYGYLTPMKEWNLEGVSIRISHPEYCGGECTRESSRLRKAEYLGTPSSGERDRLFFLIADNAVYLKHPYDKDFGTFSGDKSFEGTLEVLDAARKVVVTKKDQFKGWER